MHRRKLKPCWTQKNSCCGYARDFTCGASDEVIAKFVNSPPPVADLARVKTQLVASAIYQRDSQYSLASAYGQALSIGLTVADVQSWPQRINAVTAQDVRSNAASSLLRRESVTLFLKPGQK